MYELAAYPLIFPKGTGGWGLFPNGPGAPRYPLSTTGTQLTLHKYTRMCLFQNEHISRFSRAGNQWALDQFSRIEHSNLMFHKHELTAKQRTVRMVQRAAVPVNPARQTARVDVGRSYFLSPSFAGSRAYQKALIDDGMAIVVAMGKPTLFITITANPKWPEITAALLPGQVSSERPDLVGRVFKLKKDNLIQALRAGTYFSNRSAYILHVVEFQKRGMPHAHIAVRLAGRQPTLPSEINEIVSAEMPRVEGCPNHVINDGQGCTCDLHRLSRIVSSNLIHGCRPANCHTPARNGKPASTACKRGYPKEIRVETTIDDRGYVMYQRRELRDSNVVPHSPVLCLTYDAHINVEIAHTVKIIKYLHKYIR
jgi:hypothetical protein